jgi:hypothetical protein
MGGPGSGRKKGSGTSKTKSTIPRRTAAMRAAQKAYGLKMQKSSQPKIIKRKGSSKGLPFGEFGMTDSRGFLD